MKREPWAIGNAFAYAIRIVNSIFCRKDEPGWTEDDVESSDENTWLVVEQINSMCSDMMIEDAQDILVMVNSIPTGRLCERTNCHFHHPPNPKRSSYVDVSGDKCRECPFNQKSQVEEKDRTSHYSPD